MKIRSAGQQVSRSAGQQVSRSAGQQVSRSAGQQVSNTSINRGFFIHQQIKFSDISLRIGNPLQIFFESYELRESVEFKATGIRLFGNAVAAKLRVRCADIASSASVSELPSFLKTEFLYENGCDYITINLTEAVKMYFVNGHLDTPRHADNSLDWDRVTRLKLVHIGEKYGF